MVPLWRGGKPPSRHGSPTAGQRSSETLSTGDLFFSHRSTSCGLSLRWKATQHYYYNPRQSFLSKKTYNRCLVIALRAPVKVHLTLSQFGGQPLRLRYLNIFEPLRHPPYEEQIKFRGGSGATGPKASAQRNTCHWEDGEGARRMV